MLKHFLHDIGCALHFVFDSDAFALYVELREDERLIPCCAYTCSTPNGAITAIGRSMSLDRRWIVRTDNLLVQWKAHAYWGQYQAQVDLLAWEPDEDEQETRLARVVIDDLDHDPEHFILVTPDLTVMSCVATELEHETNRKMLLAIQEAFGVDRLKKVAGEIRERHGKPAMTEEDELVLITGG